MIKLLRHLKALEWFLLLLLIMFLVVQIYSDVTLPTYTAKIVGKMQNGESVASILSTGKTMLLYALISVGCTIMETILAAVISTSLSRRLRALIFNKVSEFSLAESNKFTTGSLLTRTTNDVQQVCSTLVLTMRLGIGAPLMATLAIIRIAQSSGELTVGVAVGVGALLLGLMTIIMIVTPKFKKVQKLTDKLNGVTRETLTGTRVVRAYNAEKFEEEKFNKVNKELTKNNLSANRTMSALNPLISMVNYGLTLTIYWLGCFIIIRDNNAAFFPTMFSFTQLASQVIMAFMVLLMLLIALPRAQISAKRINEVLKTTSAITDPKDEQSFIEEGTIEFSNVSFGYDGANNILENVSFKASKGETVAIIGATGAGKSTLLNLIPRFYEVSSGEIKVNGVNIKKVKQESLRKVLGYIPQKSTLFSGTIKENIAFSNLYLQDNEIAKFAKIACADEFIEKTALSYDSEVSQGGKNYSGGQKQRLTIARAIAAQPQILLFDDSFSALDNTTDKQLRSNLKEFLPLTTKIIVGQRISTIKDADKILVLSDGKIVGEGTHTVLINACEQYKKIALSQLSEEELAV